MTITREQVADLQPGDVVELRDEEGWPGAVVRGPLYEEEGDLCLGPLLVTRNSALRGPGTRTLTVVSRAPRPLYVNHPRTEPAPGDIVNFKSRYSGDVVGPFLYTHVERWAGTREEGRSTRWVGLPGCHPDTGPIYNAGLLRLLVDGTTGQVVQ